MDSTRFNLVTAFHSMTGLFHLSTLFFNQQTPFNLGDSHGQ